MAAKKDKLTPWTHSWNPPLYKGEGVRVFEIFLKKGVQIFSIKEGTGNIGSVSLKKEGTTYFHTNPFECHISLYFPFQSLLLIYTTFISILCISQEGLNLSESNQQICDFCKCVILEKQRYYWLRQNKLLKSVSD